MQNQGKTTVYSAEIGRELKVAAHNIRKDINYLGEIGNTNAGYDVARLKAHIHSHLGFARPRTVCIVGLGRLGSALLNYEMFKSSSCQLVAGFDKNINTLELLKTHIPLYPVYELREVVKQKAIQQAILTVTPGAAQEVADSLQEGGIKGILNFTPVIIKPRNKKVIIRNLDLLGELRLVSALLTLEEWDDEA